MSKISLAADHRSFTRDGQPFFWLADTLWSAFTNMTDQELDNYLTLRVQQGFNVLQINILPQWDRCWVPAPSMPFPVQENGMFDFSTGMQQAYFDHAAAICEKVVSYGFTPALVVLWSNYVPGTWASNLVSGNILPKERIVPYCQKVAETFSRFDPVFIVSGDTDMDTPESIEYYDMAMKELSRLCPQFLRTMHIRGRYTYLPPNIVEQMDFYMYQSGHNASYPEKCYTMPGEMLKKYPLKPLVNAEPCYEQMGYSGNQYGRFSTRDIRRAAWMSLLSGACAGITYGAHGVWNWQKPNMPFNPTTGEGFDTAKPWTEAMQFPGAWEYGHIRFLWEQYRIHSLLPCHRIANQVRGLRKVSGANGEQKTEWIHTPNDEIRMATTPDDRISLIYAPFNTRVLVQGDFRDARFRVMDLAQRRIAVPEISYRDGVTAVELCPFSEDILIVIERQERLSPHSADV